MDSYDASGAESSKNIYADFVATLKNDLDLSLPERPIKKLKTEKAQKKHKTSRKSSKLESATAYITGEVGGIDKSEKIVRNLLSHQTVQIGAFSASLIATNYYMTDENQTTDRYHIVSGGR